jgi:poly(A) polymerase/tRNA nucleotidyltransferase (CCA-adding enzyme)
MKINQKIPQEIIDIAQKLYQNGFEAYLVGGCVRDLLLDISPKDWDITTNAKPIEIQKIFENSVYENEFGTVAIKTNSQIPSLKIIEITTFRSEGKYLDKRHPSEIIFVSSLKEDLARRDFTINALAIKIPPINNDLEIIDYYNGLDDLKNKILKAVGNPNDRFNEDALRLLRAIRIATEFKLTIESETQKAIKNNARLLQIISKERIRDELIKIIMLDNASSGIEDLHKFNLLTYIIPELENTIGVSQNKHHIYDVWEHSLKSLDYAARKNFSLEIRLASLFHDIGKPQVKQGEGENATFYNHEMVGAKITKKILIRLCFPKEIVDKVTLLVKYHLFYYNVEEVTEAGVRRFIKRVGRENIDDLIKVREADRIGSGVPKARPYRLRHLLFMIDKVNSDPISVKNLKINGNDLMTNLNLSPSKRIGYLLNILLEKVLDNPKLNNKEKLLEEAKKLNKLSDSELENLALQSKNKQQEFESGILEELKKKHAV